MLDGWNKRGISQKGSEHCDGFLFVRFFFSFYLIRS